MQVRSRLARLKNSRFVRSVGVLMSGTAMASALGALTLPVVSRLYTPSEFGEFALISSIASIAAALCAFGFQAAVVKAAREAEARDLIRLGLGATMIFIGTTAVAALVIGPFWGSWQLEIPYQLAVLLVASLAVLTNVNSYLEYYANRLGRDRVLFVNSVIAALATVLISIPLGIAGLGAIGLVAGSVGALLLTVAQMMWRLRLVSRGEPSDLRGTLRSNWPFVWFQYPSDLIGALAQQMPQQSLAGMFGSHAIGSYSMTMRVLGVPLKLLGAPIATVYFREASKRVNAGGEVSGLTFGLLVRILGLSYPVIACLVVFGQPLFIYVLGSEWGEAGRLASVLAIPAVFAFCKSSVGTALVVAGRLAVNLTINTTRLVMEVAAIVAGGAISGSPMGALVAYAVASSVFLIADMTITLRLIGGAHWRYLGMSVAYATSLAGLAAAGLHFVA